MLRSVVVILIKGYQKYISPMLPPSCRFYPTCSEYARQAFEKYSFIKALYLTLKRLLKCHPYHPGGYDLLK